MNGNELPSILGLLLLFLPVGFGFGVEVGWPVELVGMMLQSQGNGGHGPQDHGEAKERRLDRFMRNNPPTFKGRFDPEVA